MENNNCQHESKLRRIERGYDRNNDTYFYIEWCAGCGEEIIAEFS